MSDEISKRQAVQQLYNTYPFPPDPLVDEPPPGYNWRWNWIGAYNFCTNKKPPSNDIRILDAGCGTGSGTDYLIHLNPSAQITAIDLSEKALEVAQERCRRSGVKAKSLEFLHLNLEQADQLEGEFNFINCVGVLHHLPDPIKGIQALAKKLAPGGLFHIFVYAELGRWGIQLMQQAISLLQGEKKGDYVDGVKVGRQIFATLPQDNPLVQYEQKKWALENQRDECFADMYVHPQEVDYNVHTLKQLIDASGLEFVGFSNPQYWNLARLIGNSPDLLARSQNLEQWEKYRLIELLDPQLTHFEFFLTKPPLIKADWSQDEVFLKAIPDRHPCMDGFPSGTLFNYDYQIIKLSDAELILLKACDENATKQESLQEILEKLNLDLSIARSLYQQQLIILH
jgi:SAM-dependent methyltransferase